MGASLPGIPGIVSGRTKDLAFGTTSSLHDGIDFWKEEIDEQNAKYKVDGQWRDLTKIVEKIKIRGKETIEFEISFTHRGPIIDYEMLR